VIVGVRQHVETGPFQLRRDLRRGSHICPAGVGLGVTFEFMDDGLEIGDGHVGAANLLDQVEKVGVAHMRPGPREQGVAGKQQTDLSAHGRPCFASL
jgi:hypothetical protein